MSVTTETRRTMDEALGDLYSKLDRTPAESIDNRLHLDRMIETLEAEIVERCARALAWYSC